MQKGIYFLKVFSFIVILTLTTVIAYGQNDPSPVEYLSSINIEFEEISKDLWTYIKVVAKGKGSRKVENKRIELINSLISAQNNVKRKPGFQGDATYRDAVIEYLRLNVIVLKEDYGKILDLEEIAERSYDDMEAYILAKELANNKIDDAAEYLDKQKEIFALDHSINLVTTESKRSQKLEQAGETFEYYNKVYLVFFKSYKQESYLMDALNNNDINGIEQNRSSLQTVSEEGIEKLRDIGDFNGDNSVKHTCILLLQFYLDESQNQLGSATDFYLKKDNMEQIRKAYDAKRKSDITQVDIDNVNKSIDEFNTALKKFNAINENLNDRRSKLLDQWNKKSDDFIEKHAV